MTPKNTTKLTDLNDDFGLIHFLESNPELFRNDKLRSEAYSSLKESQSINLLYDLSHPETFLPRFNVENFELWRLVKLALDRIQCHLGPGFWCRAIIANLPSGGEIKAHIDPGWPFSIQKRYHWVLKTNPDVEMNFDDQNFKFLKGEVWQFNNKTMHSVFNGGQTERWHLVADYVSLEDGLFTYPSEFETGSYDARLIAALMGRNKLK
jgi:hypothetical protein